MSEQQLHPLAERFFDALYDLPDELRVRKEQEQRLASAMTGGHHVCIRGFWRIGKTTMLKGALRAACERSGGAAIIVDLRDPDAEDGLPKTAESVLQRITVKVQEFLTRVGATELKPDPKAPLMVLGELAAPLFVGFDELIALHPLGVEAARTLITSLLATPKNVKVAVVCHRHRDVDALFAEAVLSNPNVHTEFVLPITDEELIQLVNGPGSEEGVVFEDEALGELADLTGNRPWELFTFAALAAAKLKPDFKGSINADAVAALFDLDTLQEREEGQAIIDNCLRILLTAMTPEERSLIELLAAGGEAEVSPDAVAALEEAGWIVTTDEGYALIGGAMSGIAQAVVQGVISVSVQ